MQIMEKDKWFIKCNSYLANYFLAPALMTVPVIFDKYKVAYQNKKCCLQVFHT